MVTVTTKAMDKPSMLRVFTWRRGQMSNPSRRSCVMAVDSPYLSNMNSAEIKILPPHAEKGRRMETIYRTCSKCERDFQNWHRWQHKAKGGSEMQRTTWKAGTGSSVFPSNPPTSSVAAPLFCNYNDTKMKKIDICFRIHAL